MPEWTGLNGISVYESCSRGNYVNGRKAIKKAREIRDELTDKHCCKVDIDDRSYIQVSRDFQDQKVVIEVTYWD